MWVLCHYSVHCHLECKLFRVGCVYIVYEELMYYFVIGIFHFYLKKKDL